MVRGMPSFSDAAAWTAAVLFPSTAIAGWALRRFAAGAFVLRMRPHFVLGYAVFALAAFHTMTAVPAIAAMGQADVWVASFALAGLALEAFAGASLQAPGLYRPLLRRWHTTAFWTIGVLIVLHVLLTGVL